VGVRPDGRRPGAYEDKEVLRCGVEAAPRGLHRQRLLFGLQYRYEMLLAGAQVITDLLSPSDANSGQNKSDLKDEKRQSTVVLEIGAMF